MASADEARAGFEATFGHAPTVMARAPGRVNLIGEHTDYAELPVMPIAIERALYVAATRTDDPRGRVHAVSQQYGATEATRDAIEAGEGWQRYLIGVLREMHGVGDGYGAEVFVTGDLPPAGGLSSSSALTVGLMAALNDAWGGSLGPEEIVERAIVAERHVGVESGGMDQNVIVFAQAGHALRIDFRPLERRHVPIPEGLAFVVASSGTEAPKGGSARDSYNELVVGSRIAAAMLADQLGVDIDQPPVLGAIRGIDVVDILVDDLPERVSPQEVAHGVDLDVENLVRLTSGRFDHMAKVPVRRVARHMLSEADRVDAAEEALRSGDVRRFGKLLDESHNSLRQDLKASTPELDRLCAAMRRAGAYGARLTGAGFGGYALAAVGPEHIDAVIAAAIEAAGGPAFEVHASAGLARL